MAIKLQAASIVNGDNCFPFIRGGISYTYLCKSTETSAITGEENDFLFEVNTGLTKYWDKDTNQWEVVGKDAEE